MMTHSHLKEDERLTIYSGRGFRLTDDYGKVVCDIFKSS